MENNTAPARPALVWVIAIFYAVSALWTGLAFYLLLSGKAQLSPLQQRYFESLTVMSYLGTSATVLLNLGGAAALLALRRSAFGLFAAGLAVSVASTLLEIFTKGWLAAFGGSGIGGAAAGWIIAAAVCVYARRLAAKGVLN